MASAFDLKPTHNELLTQYFDQFRGDRRTALMGIIYLAIEESKLEAGEINTVLLHMLTQRCSVDAICRRMAELQRQGLIDCAM
jgi:hypothetical protein